MRYSRHGRAVTEDEALDERGSLRDGYAVTVPMTMRDQASLTPLQRSIAQSAAQLHDGRGGAVGHRPGYVVSTDASLNDAKERAYATYDAELRDAYKHPQGCRGDIDASDEAHDAMAMMDERERAYAAYDAAVTDAWRGHDSGKG